MHDAGLNDPLDEKEEEDDDDDDEVSHGCNGFCFLFFFLIKFDVLLKYVLTVTLNKWSR
jgi:hypothetical protein